MKQIWAPWRIEYIGRRRKGKCFLCDRDEEFMVYDGRECFVIANAFPYNNGHLMVAPYRHVRRLEELKDDEILEMIKLTSLCMKVLEKWGKPHGFNVGINIGRDAGAGEEHLHQHVVPRWRGDTNFMPVLAEVKVIPQHLKRTCEELRKIFSSIKR